MASQDCYNQNTEILQKHFGNCQEGEIEDDTHVSAWTSSLWWGLLL